MNALATHINPIDMVPAFMSPMKFTIVNPTSKSIIVTVGFFVRNRNDIAIITIMASQTPSFP